MRKNKSPDVQARARKKRGNAVTSSYPAEPAPVKKIRICYGCDYFRSIPFLRGRRLFCLFTGERVAETWTCDFWTMAGGASC